MKHFKSIVQEVTVLSSFGMKWKHLVKQEALTPLKRARGDLLNLITPSTKYKLGSYTHAAKDDPPSVLNDFKSPRLSSVTPSGSAAAAAAYLHIST